MFTQPWDQAAEQLLRKLPGILAVRFLADDSALTAIHILADTCRNAKQIVRDVQAALSAAYGLDIDHRIVSVAQIPQEAAPPPVAEEPRVRFCGLSFQEAGGRCRVEVTLAYHAASCVGQAEGKAGARWRDRLAAQATLNAVHRLLGQEEVYLLLNVQRVPTSMVTLAAVLVQMTDSDVLLAGAAVLEDEALHGVVRATLDALNRNLARRIPLIEQRKETGPSDGGPSLI